VLLSNALSRQTCVTALEPVLTQDDTLRAHPLVCQALGVVQGEPVAVHLPLSEEAQRDALALLPGERDFGLAPSTAAVLGCAHLTCADGQVSRPFASPAEVLLAHSLGKVGVNTPLRVRLPPEKSVIQEGGDGHLVTTAGRVLFNDLLPE